MPPSHSGSAASPRRPFYRILYIQVLIAVFAGAAIGVLWPDTGKDLKPLGDGFIKLVRMIIAPIVFCSVVHGIAGMRDIRKLGRLGAKTLFYFEVVSTLALAIGLVVVNVLKPGAGFDVDPKLLDPASVQTSATQANAYVTQANAYATQASKLSLVEFLLNIIPTNFVDALARGDLLQVLLIAVLTGFAISFMGERGRPTLNGLEMASRVFFGIMAIVVKAAPIGALGAMAFTVGSFGIGALRPLLSLMLGFYLTAGVFVVLVLGLIARFAGFSIFRFIRYIREELFLVLGTSSSETALPGMLQKMKALGCAESTVGMVIPSGYSFNLDGTNIYMTMAAIFLAQATNTPLSLGQQLGLLGVAMLSSKGASGVTGAGFITLAATLAVVPAIPIQSLALIVGIDRFMSECRALTNLIGNGVATVVISRWEGEIDAGQLNAKLASAAAGGGSR